MIKVGDLIIYSAHGICKVDDICKKTFSGITRKYYVLHPIQDDHKLRISAPVDSDQVVMLELMNQEEAQELLLSFKDSGVNWIDNPNLRHHSYSDIVNTGDRKEIAKVVNTLMKKKFEAERNEKKLYEQDRKLLDSVQNTLFNELAISLNRPLDEITKTVTKYVMK